jgi:hypothetical protein
MDRKLRFRESSSVLCHPWAANLHAFQAPPRNQSLPPPRKGSAFLRYLSFGGRPPDRRFCVPLPTLPASASCSIHNNSIKSSRARRQIRRLSRRYVTPRPATVVRSHFICAVYGKWVEATRDTTSPQKNSQSLVGRFSCGPGRLRRLPRAEFGGACFTQTNSTAACVIFCYCPTWL